MPKLEEDVRIERRQALIDAASRCISNRGFSSVTVDDVCAEAGVSKGAFYIYFDAKHDLLLALLDDDAAAVDQIMEELGSSAVRGDEKLHRLARAMLERGADPSRLQVRADIWAEVQADATLRARFATVVARQRATLRDWIESSVRSGELKDVPSNALAAILLALDDGLMLHALLDPNAFRWRKIDAALGRLLQGISEA